eukprot:6581289-Karenia_brevis.AAC.1
MSFNSKDMRLILKLVVKAKANSNSSSWKHMTQDQQDDWVITLDKRTRAALRDISMAVAAQAKSKRVKDEDKVAYKLAWLGENGMASGDEHASDVTSQDGSPLPE